MVVQSPAAYEVTPASFSISENTTTDPSAGKDILTMPPLLRPSELRTTQAWGSLIRAFRWTVSRAHTVRQAVLYRSSSSPVACDAVWTVTAVLEQPVSSGHW